MKNTLSPHSFFKTSMLVVFLHLIMYPFIQIFSIWESLNYYTGRHSSATPSECERQDLSLSLLLPVPALDLSSLAVDPNMFRSRPCGNLSWRQYRSVSSGEASRGLLGVTIKDCFQARCSLINIRWISSIKSPYVNCYYQYYYANYHNSNYSISFFFSWFSIP
jgi:hypothetical protein